MILNNDLLTTARDFIGLEETPGDANTPFIMEMARVLGMTHYTFDSRDWCGLFMSFVTHISGGEMPASPLLARNWLSVGIRVVEPLKPMPGDICVLWRTDINGEDGHVGLFEKQVDNKVWLIGGNQVDTVRSFYYDAERVLGYRRLWRAR